jgi:hypothetical protein
MRNVTTRNRSPSCGEEHPQHPRTTGRHRPDFHADWTPLPEQQEQRQAGKQHERRSLDRPRNHLRPPVLEPRRAITLCWTAKIVSSTASIGERRGERRLRAPSRRVGTPKPPTNAIA